jgi:hypothetical protein
LSPVIRHGHRLRIGGDGGSENRTYDDEKDDEAV